jgi:alpha-tubulin suppressor-like RCC1 family protein
MHLQGDMDNDELFQTGFDGARQISYQYVTNPEPVAALQDKRVTHIACGEEHSAAVTSASLSAVAVMSPKSLTHVRVAGDGALFCWGCGRDGRLGNGSGEDELLPLAVQSLASVRVAKVACGPRQTVGVLLTRRMRMGSSRTVADARVRPLSPSLP